MTDALLRAILAEIKVSNGLQQIANGLKQLDLVDRQEFPEEKRNMVTAIEKIIYAEKEKLESAAKEGQKE